MTVSCPDPETRCVKYEDSHEYSASSLFFGSTIVNLLFVASNLYCEEGYKTTPFFVHLIVVSLKNKLTNFIYINITNLQFKRLYRHAKTFKFRFSVKIFL